MTITYLSFVLCSQNRCMIEIFNKNKNLRNYFNYVRVDHSKSINYNY